MTEPVRVVESMHRRIAEHLRRQITGGELPAGVRIPGEIQLAGQFGVSRMTARQAVQTLSREGLLFRRQGLGTFVAEPKYERGLARLTTLSEEYQSANGGQLAVEHLRARVFPAPDPVARAFGLAPGEPVLFIRRLQGDRIGPILLQLVCLPAALFPGLDVADMAQSLYRVAEDRFGIAIGHAEQRIEAVAATPAQARILQVPPGAPLLRAWRRTFTRTGQVLELTRNFYRADRYAFRSILHR